MGLRRGAEYLSALRDGRRLWMTQDNEMVNDVTEHPLLAPLSHKLAETYDLQFDPQYQSVLAAVGSDGELASLSYIPPTSIAELNRMWQMYAFLMRRCGGELGRPPQYLSTLITAMYCQRHQLRKLKPDYDYVGNVERFYEHCRDHDLALTYAGSDPSSPRHIPAEAKHYLKIVETRPEGIVVSGAKAFATLAPQSDEVYAVTTPRPGLTPEEILIFAVPMNAPGLTVICRESYTKQPPEDYPLSSLYDESDSWVVFDRVLVPNDRVFLLFDYSLNMTFFSDIHQTFSHFLATARILVKLETMAGICFAITEYQGTQGDAQVQEALAEMVTHIQILRTLIESAERNAVEFGDGFVRAEPDIVRNARMLGMEWHGRFMEIMTVLCSSSLLIVPSDATLNDPDLGALINRYVAGGDDHAAERFKMLKLAREYSSNAFAVRQYAFEMHSSATLGMNRQGVFRGFDATPLKNLAKSLVGIPPEAPRTRGQGPR